MPFYDLKCKSCGKVFNIMAKMNDRENKTVKCPVCSGNELDAIFNNVNIVKSRKNQPEACPNAHRCNGCCEH